MKSVKVMLSSGHSICAEYKTEALAIAARDALLNIVIPILSQNAYSRSFTLIDFGSAKFLADAFIGVEMTSRC